MNPERLVNWLRGKLDEHGVEKVIPGHGVLGDTCRRALLMQDVEKYARRKQAEFAKRGVSGDLTDRLTKVARWPTTSWDEAVWEIARGVKK